MAGMKFRPRFSIRTLAIVVTLVCCYFGAWRLTNNHAGPNEVPMPFVICGEESTTPAAPGSPKKVLRWHYYFWFFGYVRKLPIVLEP